MKTRNSKIALSINQPINQPIGYLFIFVIRLRICNLVCLKMTVFGRNMSP